MWIGALSASLSFAALAQPPTREAVAPAAGANDASSPRREGAPPRALVVVSTPTALDAFVPAFAYELVAAPLRAAGFDVIPPQVAGAALRAQPRGEACAADPSCLRALARSVGAGTVVSLVLTGPREGVARYGHLGRELAEGAIAGSSDRALADALQTVAATLTEEPAPCRVVFDAVDVAPRWRVDGALAVGREIFVGPGEHRVTAETEGRAPWRGTLRCEGGRGLRVRAR